MIPLEKILNKTDAFFFFLPSVTLHWKGVRAAQLCLEGIFLHWLLLFGAPLASVFPQSKIHRPPVLGSTESGRGLILVKKTDFCPVESDYFGSEP
jgi:hypothetical protein